MGDGKFKELGWEMLADNETSFSIQFRVNLSVFEFRSLAREVIWNALLLNRLREKLSEVF